MESQNFMDIYFSILKKYFVYLGSQHCIISVLCQNIKFKIGYGSSNLFRSNVWIGSNALHIMHNIFPRIYKVFAIQNGSVHEMEQWLNDHWRWNLVWHKNILSYEEQ